MSSNFPPPSPFLLPTTTLNIHKTSDKEELHTSDQLQGTRLYLPIKYSLPFPASFGIWRGIGSSPTPICMQSSTLHLPLLVSMRSALESRHTDLTYSHFRMADNTANEENGAAKGPWTEQEKVCREYVLTLYHADLSSTPSSYKSSTNLQETRVSSYLKSTCLAAPPSRSPMFGLRLGQMLLLPLTVVALPLRQNLL